MGREDDLAFIQDLSGDNGLHFPGATNGPEVFSMATGEKPIISLSEPALGKPLFIVKGGLSLLTYAGPNEEQNPKVSCPKHSLSLLS